MSFIDDDLRRADAALDKFQLREAEERIAVAGADSDKISARPGEDPRTTQLKAVIRSLSTTASSRPLLRRSKVRALLTEVLKKSQKQVTTETTDSSDITNLEWVATGKATAQTYGLILDSLLDRTIPLSESIWYWDDVLGSYANIVLYTVQTSPFRFYKQAKEVYADAVRKLPDVRAAGREATNTLSERWRQFYGLVRDSVKERSLAQAQTKILSPFSIARMEVRGNLQRVKEIRKTSSASIGRLVRECMVFEGPPDERKIGALPQMLGSPEEDWQTTIARTVCLLDSATKPHGEDENYAIDPSTASSTEVANLLIKILDEQLPKREKEVNDIRRRFGKPSKLVRYWIPALGLFLSGSTLLRILLSRKADIAQWFREFGQTCIDFWTNWVVEPTKKLIGTIRHDEQSEIAIQSKDSLKADKESLERMVVDFAVQHPVDGSRYNESQIAEIRAKVKAGDVTPVLKAYERELQSPIKNAIMGELVRTLLIQVQKTKVDVETAIGGIDSLLKSQELLFGFVGIAPGVLISYALVQWLRSAFGGREGPRQGKRKGEAIRLIRNIDRTLTNSDLDDDGIISEENHGLLLCETHLLRQRAVLVLPKSIQREFLEDLDDLLDVKAGVGRQINVLRRIEWAYAKWLQ
ncbi:ATP synthase regulation protein NCA2-domain-containing protein [Exophiala viscosa]|uniref:ATP synthase regulation protein NCA2-domain-containing protein n=1 Tax=Exophiala viscosa TaxID=2486360 RepID=A0AAN6IIJ8_9EURO|nr:ATP synthase regulation protein NCA2-domain-containing protein [Exophiala viscosa]KAI1627623.1 ATP synthase regulation protein NCA2-domain-containing protein [Exophiala viscosa]